jgi:four helix bundle protein
MQNAKCKMSENLLKDKSYNFALRTVKLYRHLVQGKAEFVLSKQVLRSGTSIGANIIEANRGESKSDFIHKLSIALKEAYETEYWLNLLRDSEFLTERQTVSILGECQELQKLLTASIKTAKSKQ